MARSSHHLLGTAVLLLLAGCSYAAMTGTVAPDIALPTYQNALVTPSSAARNVVARELLSRGFRVTLLESEAWLNEIDAAEGTTMLVTCTYLGHTGSDMLGSTGANASCDAVDLRSRKPVYSGQGKHTGLTEDGDIQGAVRNALKALPSLGRAGSMLSYGSLPLRPKPQAVPAPVPPALPPRAPEQASERTGSGFLIATGTLLTNAHVVDGCSEIRAADKRMRVLAIDRTNDLALLGGDLPGAPLPLRTRPFPRLGEPVTALGYPLASLFSSQLTVTTGNISALAGIEGDTRFIQTSAPVQPGNSGGPLIDESGSVIGVVVAKLDAARVFSLTGDIPQNINFAISPSIVRGFLDASDVQYAPATQATTRARADVIASIAPSVSLVTCR